MKTIIVMEIDSKLFFYIHIKKLFQLAQITTLTALLNYLLALMDIIHVTEILLMTVLFKTANSFSISIKDTF